MNRKNVFVRASWALSALLATGGVAVLLWPTQEAPRPFSRKPIDYPVSLVAPSRADAPAALADFVKVRDLEAQHDEEGLKTLALSAPVEGETPEHHAQIRYGAVHAIGNVGGPRAVKFLRSLLADGRRDLIVRLAAASALGRSGGPDEIAYLRERLLSEPSNIVREKIRLALVGKD